MQGQPINQSIKSSDEVFIRVGPIILIIQGIIMLFFVTKSGPS